MGPFALPVPQWRLGSSSRKRKRHAETQSENSPSPEPEVVASASHLPSDSINPRSHSPNTLRQFAIAGLSPGEEIPSKIHPTFPHRALPPKWQYGGVPSRRSRSRLSATTSGSETDGDTDVESLKQRREEVLAGGSEKFRYMSTMMAILHRCIHENDMPRAKRAFGLLIRTPEVDMRINEMWTLGTEILMREGETRGQRHPSRDPAQMQDDLATDSGEETMDPRPPPPRWGSADNMAKARDYLETLAQHHPYDHHYPRSISAVDFWPALYNIEIYNIDVEHRRALHRLEESDPVADDDNESLPPASQDGSEDYDAQILRRHDDRAGAKWAARDEIRHETQVAAQQIAERMDDLMQTVPYTTHIELLRLRGMLALFIGDLYLPARLLDSGDFAGSNIGNRLQELSLAANIRKYIQSQEDRDAVRRRNEEIEKSRGFFGRIVEKGGELEPWLSKFLDPDDNDDDDASSLL
ncbi:hypothetical protein SCUP234_11848 [Seiridium cupressi]